MQTIARHFSFSSQAKQVAMPTYWCALGSNDRTPEIKSGSMEDRVS
jgi:hypothetical protein